MASKFVLKRVSKASALLAMSEMYVTARACEEGIAAEKAYAAAATMEDRTRERQGE